MLRGQLAMPISSVVKWSAFTGSYSEEIYRGRRAILPCLENEQVDPSPQCEGVFQLFDSDRSGQIDAREFMISLTNFAGASKDDKLKFAFMVFDEDGNGVITKQEARNGNQTKRYKNHAA